MAQDPARYTPDQKAAADVVLRWFDDTNRKDLADQMTIVDDEIVYRNDPSETLGHGARGFCSAYNFAWDVSWERFDEMYVVAGPSEALVLVKRADMNFGASASGLGGDPVAVAMFARVRNGKLVEWLDAPMNRIGGLTTTGGTPGRSRSTFDLSAQSIPPRPISARRGQPVGRRRDSECRVQRLSLSCQR